jgi:predicted aspartyl protease
MLASLFCFSRIVAFRVMIPLMGQRRSQFAASLIAAAALAISGNDAPAADAQTEETPPPVELPKPVRTEPQIMPALPPAIIDDTLAIGGDNIDAKKVRTRMTISVNVNGSGPWRFVVDSGADTSVIGTRLAAKLALQPGRSVTLNGMTGSSIVPRVLVDSLELGPTSTADLELPVLDEHDLGGDGMLGIDAIADERLMMDFEKRIITIEDSTKPEPKWNGEIVVTARRKRGQLILTQVKVNKQGVDAVVDTGSEITIGNSALRDALRARNSRMEKIEVTGVTGVTVNMDLLRVSEIKLGSITLKNVPIAFADVPPFQVFGLDAEPSLLLGTDLMEVFRRISLDFRARKVRFQLRKCKNSGIKLSTSFNGSLARLGVEEGGEAACMR